MWTDFILLLIKVVTYVHYSLNITKNVAHLRCLLYIFDFLFVLFLVVWVPNLQNTTETINDDHNQETRIAAQETEDNLINWMLDSSYKYNICGIGSLFDINGIFNCYSITVSNIIYFFLYKSFILLFPMSFLFELFILFQGYVVLFERWDDIQNRTWKVIALISCIICFLFAMFTITITMIILQFITLIWIDLFVIKPCFNARVAGWDGNLRFWQKVIDWTLESKNTIEMIPINDYNNSDDELQLVPAQRCTDDRLLRIISINKELCDIYVPSFINKKLGMFIEKNYRNIFYNFRKIDNSDSSDTSSSNNRNFNRHSGYNYSDLRSAENNDFYQTCNLFYVVCVDQGKQWCKKQTEKINQYFVVIYYLFMTYFIFPITKYTGLALLLNINPNNLQINLNTIETDNARLMEYFTLFCGILWFIVAVPCYFISKLLDIVFIVFVFCLTMIKVFSSVSGGVIDDININITFSYFEFITCWSLILVVMIGLIYFCFNVYETLHIIWHIWPGKFGNSALYISKYVKSIYWERVEWYYKTHINAPVIGAILCQKFGKDVASTIAVYLPRTYKEEQECFEQDKKERETQKQEKDDNDDDQLLGDDQENKNDPLLDILEQKAQKLDHEKQVLARKETLKKAKTGVAHTIH